MVRKISYVLPVYNEEENLRPLFAELKKVSESLACPYEVWFVDDSSRDGSLDMIKQLAAEQAQVHYLSFSCNLGQSAALYAGFQAVTGDVVITLDADLQNDPADIPAMLARYGEYDMVTGWRFNRQDTLAKKIGSRIGNAVRNCLTGESIRDTGCSLKVMNAAMVKRIPMFRGLHRFLPTLMRLEGARVLQVRVHHRSRRHGMSKYNNLQRGLEGIQDVLAVRWMIKRHLAIQVRERHV